MTEILGEETTTKTKKNKEEPVACTSKVIWESLPTTKFEGKGNNKIEENEGKVRQV